MLQLMREKLRYLKWVLGIVIFSFLSWGATSWVGGGAPGAQSGWAARVNGETISATSFQSSARRLNDRYQSILGEQYTQQRSFLRVGQQAINQMVEEELLYQEALSQKIHLSPQEVAQAITRDPNFLEGGRFIGLQRYRELFRNSNFSIEEYEGRLRRGLLIDKCRSLIADGVMVTDAEVRAEYLRQNETANVDYLAINAEKLLGSTQPADKDIDEFYAANTDRYMRGEGRNGIYVLFDARELSASREIDEGAVRAAYDRDRELRYDVKQQRRASHILFRVPQGAGDEEVAKVEASARAVLEEARGGAEFAALAKEHSEDSSAANGGDLNFFGRGQMVPEFETAAFALEVGGLSDLVKTTYGFHIIKVTDATEARVIPFEEVHDRIRDELSLAQGRQEALQRASTLSRAAAGGRLRAVAESQGLLINDTGAVHAGEALSTLPASYGIVSIMISLDPDDVSDPIPVSSGQVVVQVEGVVPDSPYPLDEVREKVNDDLLGDLAIRRVKQALESTRDKGEGITELARRLDTEVKTRENLARGASLPGISRDETINRQLRSLPPRSLGEPVTTASGIVVLSVRERVDHLDEFASRRDATFDTLLQQRRDRLVRGFVKRLRENGQVEINNPLVQAVDRN